jgi:argininosuccinate lyase
MDCSSCHVLAINKKTTDNQMSSQKEKSQVWGSRLAASPDELNLEFCSGRDVKALPMADVSLIGFDIWTNLAHASMLCKSGIINDAEFLELKGALLEVQELSSSSQFILDPDKEDIHINIEHYITHTRNLLAGKKIHSGRSRNDQVVTDMRLYLRAETIQLAENVAFLIEAIMDKAHSERESIMPGFTHYQPAMITTAGHWLTSWSQALLRDLSRMLTLLSTLNLSPLGAAASFGTSWPIDREVSAELLGFDGVEENSLDCISSRGELESDIASAISIMMNHLSTISQDLILLSTPYYNMLKIDDRFVTGSSIMPQKRNPDFAEIIRGKAASSHGTLVSLLGILKGAMSGYNKDSQQSKYLIMDLFRECKSAPLLLAEIVRTLQFKRDEMLRQSEADFMNSADFADWLAQKHHLPFRECYELISLTVKYSEASGRMTHEAVCRAIMESNLDIEISVDEIDMINTPSSLINQKNHTGGPAVSSVEKMITNQKDKLADLRTQLHGVKDRIETAWKKCFESN